MKYHGTCPKKGRFDVHESRVVSGFHFGDAGEVECPVCKEFHTVSKGSWSEAKEKEGREDPNPAR